MIRISILMILIFLISCSNKNQGTKSISSNSDTVLIQDKCFYDFIYDFMIHKDFQLSRVKIDEWNYKNYFADKDYSLHFFQSFKLPEKEFEKDLRNIKYLTIIDPKDKTSLLIKFSKENENWYLSEIVNKEFLTDSVIDFETFLYQFSTDTVFMRNHIRFPLKYSYVDPEKDFADTTEFLDSNSNLRYNFFDKEYLMFFHDSPKIDSKKIMILLRGIDNGLNSYYYFEKHEDVWILIEEKEYST